MDQVRAVLVVPVTEVENCWFAPAGTEAVPGVRMTATGLVRVMEAEPFLVVSAMLVAVMVMIWPELTGTGVE